MSLAFLRFRRRSQPEKLCRARLLDLHRLRNWNYGGLELPKQAL
jgi:hypothetical protein